MKFIKCSKRQKKVVLMIILLLISYYIYIRGLTYSKNNNSRYVGRYIHAYIKYLCGYFWSNCLERPKLVSKLTSLLPIIKQGNTQRLLNWGDLSHMNNENLLSTENEKSCKYLIMLLNPWDLPSDCISTEFEEQKFNSTSDSSIFIMEHNLSNNLWKKELYRTISERTNNMKALEDYVILVRLGEDLEGELSNFFKGKNFQRETGEDYLNRLLDMSLDLDFSDSECKRNVNIRRLWEFGRLYHELNKSSGSYTAGESKYYKDFLAFVYYKCIYGVESSNMAKDLEKSTENDHPFNKFRIGDKTDSDKQGPFFEVIACYQLIPTFGIEDNELVSLGKLCDWEFESKDFYVQSDIDQEKIRLIRQHITQIDEIYSKLDIIRLNHKYYQNLAKENKIEDFQTSYLNQLILLLKKTTRQIMIQYTYITEEIGSFIDSSQKVDQLSEAISPNKPNSYPIISTTGLINSISNSNNNKQVSDSINWKQLISSIIDNTQNILVREHINTMLINFLFDTIINMLNPWISLFYQASFIINSYLSIISFLLVIVAILVCFNTIPCFRNEKDEQKSQKIWAKVLRIYKANAMVILLNVIFILGGLLRYLYLPNEIELLNTNIAIIKAVNKVLNIILCPCVVNIITSFSTVFSIFQWQFIWMSRKLSFSSLINL
ncbi:uncharacterized protein ELE39_001852 [Cryptosporidium sp. chipmunk genotype I]|uniref:uncharacterized protein n=1 Tax=Cryptosporidium sp. chipmunk genotype I TaxID=1280935 RepID=UPI003519F5D2|nr:hypothetical protein ELE39_001852 [Cryptosporidium sp. chipmunk genotype I]